MIPILILSAFVLMNPSTTWNDPDTFWHIELGRTMIQEQTILREAIHTFTPNLPYVPHEIGFQLVVGGLYGLWGWKGVHTLTVICLGFMIWGLYRLAKISRKEMGYEAEHPYLTLIIPVVSLVIFLLYFKIRPQMVSAPIVIWFFVFLREFQWQPSFLKALYLGLLSLALSNVHTGVWPLIGVFFMMALLESAWARNLTKHHISAMIFILLGGVLNAGGWRTLVYFHTIGKTGFTAFISEWHPIHFNEDTIFFTIIVLFVWSAMYSARKTIFRFVFMVGILYLGVANYKQQLYMELFLIYFLAIAIDHVPWLNGFKRLDWVVRPSFLRWVFGLGLAVNLIMGWSISYEEPQSTYPVKEMDYILEHHAEGRPKVLAPYSSSGYVMFRGGDILADGRMDPFIIDETRGVHQWTAFERSMYAYQSEEIMSIIEFDKPQYVIMPKPKAKDAWGLEDISYHKIHNTLGEPIFQGDYGEVYQIQ